VIRLSQNNIVVDNREKHNNSESACLISALDRYQISYTIEMLPIADLLIKSPTGGVLAIERKTAEDFILSTTSGHLHSEIERLNQAYEKSILIIEGNFDKYIKKRVALKKAGFVKNPYFFNSAHKAGILTSITLRTRTKIIQTVSMDETIAVLNALSSKFEDGRTFEVPQFKRAKTEEKIYINLLLSFPGVSQNKAQKIMEKYKSWADFSHHVLNNTFELNGFGTKSVEMFKRALI
jgi:ERCC4-type nuclease